MRKTPFPNWQGFQSLKDLLIISYNKNAKIGFPK